MTQFLGVGQHHQANWRWRTCHIHHGCTRSPVILFSCDLHPVPVYSTQKPVLHQSAASSFITIITNQFSDINVNPVVSSLVAVLMQRGFPSSLMFSSQIEETAFTRTVINPNGWTGTNHIFMHLYIYKK